MTGIEAFLEILAAAGCTHLFGNPGTTELPLQDALARDARFRYVFGIHEIPVMALADGYALASRKVAVVNLHIGCGLGNAMGMLYNAHVEGAPLLVTAGQQDRRLLFEEPVLATDLVRVAQPWTKWAAEIHRVQDIPNAVRRAIQTALTPPTGPVFLSLPVDLQMETAEGLDLRPPFVPSPVRPARQAIRRAAELLTSAKNPAIIAGSRVVEAGGSDELARLAELLGAPVFAEPTTMHGRVPMRPDHPLYQGLLPLWSPEIEATLREFDTLLIVGANFLRLYIHLEPADPIARGTRLIHLDSDACEIGKNYPIDVGVLGDPVASLSELIDELRPRCSAPQRAARAQLWTERKKQATAAFQATLDAHAADRPMTSWTMMGTLARVLPKNVAVVEEALTSHHHALERLGVVQDPAALIAHRGWALGWGMGCALGVKLAWPQRPVLGLIGDGAALYGIQALWSAAHHDIPATFLICKNRQYKILKACGEIMRLPRLSQPGCPGMNLNEPDVDYVGLARSLGVEGFVVHTPEELAERVVDGLRAPRPRLIEAPLADSTWGELARHGSQG